MDLWVEGGIQDQTSRRSGAFRCSDGGKCVLGDGVFGCVSE